MLNRDFNAKLQNSYNPSPLDKELYNQIKNEEVASGSIKLYLSKIENFLSLDHSVDHPDYYELERQRSSLYDYVILAEDREKAEERINPKNYITNQPKVNIEQIKEDVELLVEDESLTEADIVSNLSFMGKKWGVHYLQLKEFYQAKKAEVERNEDFGQSRLQLSELLSLEENRLDIREVIPDKYGELVLDFCKYLDFRPEVALTTLIGGISSCFDYRSQVLLAHQTNYYQSSQLYTAIVAESGIGKSTLLKKFIINFLKTHQNRAEEEFQAKVSQVKKDIADYKLLSKEEKREYYPDGEPELPDRAKRYYYTESTLEAFARSYREYPGKTLLYASDELNKLFKSLGKYSGGDNGDMEKLLELYDRSPLCIGRAGKEGNLYIPQTGLSIFGGVQPEVLKEIWSDGNDREGKSSRFIYCYQPLNNPQLDPEDNEQIRCPLDEKLEFLYGLLLQEPVRNYRLTKTGRRRYINFFNECSDLNHREDNRFLGHVYSKAKGQAGRLILNLHAINSIWAKQYSGVSEEIPDETVEKGIKLTRFYINQVKLLLHNLCPDDELTPKLRDIFNLSRKSEKVTARDAKRLCRSLRDESPNVIREMFQTLENMGYGENIGTGKKRYFLRKLG